MEEEFIGTFKFFFKSLRDLLLITKDCWSFNKFLSYEDNSSYRFQTLSCKYFLRLLLEVISIWNLDRIRKKRRGKKMT